MRYLHLGKEHLETKVWEAHCRFGIIHSLLIIYMLKWLGQERKVTRTSKVLICPPLCSW